MSISVNGQSSVPPGFRFHPTEEELLGYYLRKKAASEEIDLDVIRDVDLNKLEPWDIQERCRIGSTPQNDWYFFSHKDKKYPTGTRTNRATAAGFWKATGRDKAIHAGGGRIGMRKTLVFYKGRAPHGQKSDWIMHEYRLDDHPSSLILSNSMGETGNQEEGWVVCRVFKKKSLLNRPSTAAADADAHLALHSGGDGALDQILQYMGRSCKQETESNASSHLCPIETFFKLPAFESPAAPSMHDQAGLRDWAALDRLVASQLNGQSEDPTSFLFCHSVSQDDNDSGGGGGGRGDGDLWSLASSASDLIGHVSHTSI